MPSCSWESFCGRGFDEQALEPVGAGGPGLCAHQRAGPSSTRLSLENNFTSHFNTQNFSDLIPVPPCLVLTLGAADCFFGHCFKCVGLIADVSAISRHVFEGNLEIH